MGEIAPIDPRPALDESDDEADTEPEFRLVNLGDKLYAYQKYESGKWRTVDLLTLEKEET